MKSLKKPVVVDRSKKAAESGPKLRKRRAVDEAPLGEAAAAKAWERWVKRGPQGPIEDDTEIPV